MNTKKLLKEAHQNLRNTLDILQKLSIEDNYIEDEVHKLIVDIGKNIHREEYNLSKLIN